MVFDEISKEGIGMDWSQFYKNLTTNDPLELKSFVTKQASRKGSIQERTKDLLERMGYASNSNL
jgi:hypothetical protein